jgi:hypothetical protein
MIKMLFTSYKVMRKLTDGKHASPGVTAVSRLVLVCVVFGLGGAPILAHAVRTMPAVLWFILVLGFGLRIVLWFWRRHR